MSVTIAASSSTHFLWNGNPMPRVYRVAPHGAQDARLENVETGQFLIVLSDAIVAGSVRANQAALIAALSPLVSPAAGEGGGEVNVDIDEAAIGNAVNDAIRLGGPLPAPNPIRPEHPPGTPVDFPVSLTLTDGTERVIVVDGVALPRTLFIYRTGSDAITIRYRGAAGDPWVNFQTFTADSQVAIRDPIQALSVQRTAGSGTTSRVTLR